MTDHCAQVHDTIRETVEHYRDYLSQEEQDRLEVVWDIRREGRPWSGRENPPRWLLLPEKIEIMRGELVTSGTEPIALLALLLEQVGIDHALCLGDPQLWRDAIAERHGAGG
jgi:hypothetical protein